MTPGRSSILSVIVGSLLAAELACAGDAPLIVAKQGTLFAPSQSPSLGALVVPAGASVHFDTGSGTSSPQVQGVVNGKGAIGRSASGKVEVSLFSFERIDLGPGATVTISGDRGLVLMSRSTMTIATVLDVSGKPGVRLGNRNNHPGGEGGPGAEGGIRTKATASAPPPPDAGDGGLGRNGFDNPGRGKGGGQARRCLGGSSGGGGGYGGAGGRSSEGAPLNAADSVGRTHLVSHEGGIVYGDAQLTDLFGGSGGGGGQNDRNFDFASAGGGGGAIALIAAGEFRLAADGRILARGGAPGIYRASGAGGSGGGILIAAPTVALAAGSLIDASGATAAAIPPEFEPQFKTKKEGTEFPGGRMQFSIGGGGGGGRIAIYSATDLGQPGKGLATKVPAGIAVDGGPVTSAPQQPDFIFKHRKLGDRKISDVWPTSGSAGTFFEGAWPNLR